MPVTKVDELSDNGRAHRSVIVEQHWGAMTRTPVPRLDPLGAAILTSALIDQQSGLALCADSISSVPLPVSPKEKIASESRPPLVDIQIQSTAEAPVKR